MLNMSKANRTDETIACLRRACPGIAPGTEHRPSATANMCGVVALTPEPEDEEA